MGIRAAFVTLALALSRPSLAAIFDNPSSLPSGKQYDFIVVGSGAAGATVANRLTEDPNTSVLVIEAGVSDKNQLNLTVPFFTTHASPNTAFDWNFTTVPQTSLNGRQLPYPRGFVLGGTTSINTMAYTRGSSEDWDRLANFTGDEGWSWDSIFPQYVFKNEILTPPADNHNTSGQINPSFHGTSGINGDSLAGLPSPIDDKVIGTLSELSDEFPFNEEPNSGNHLGISWQLVTVRGGERSSSSTSYLAPQFVSRPNLDVVLNTRVTRVLAQDPSSPTVFRTVEFAETADGPRQNLTAQKEIILSAGTVGTANILLHSGIGPSQSISPLGIDTVLDNPSVGFNFTDHPGIAQAWFVNNTDTWELALRNTTIAAEQFAEWNATRTGPLTAPLLPQLGWLRLPDNSSIFDQFADPASGPNSAHYEILFANGLSDFTVPSEGNFFSILTAVASPLSRGSIRINSTNPFDAPLVDPNFLSSEFDFFVMRESLLSAQRFLTASFWEGYILEPFMSPTEDELDEYIRSNARSFFHGVGSASMSPKGASFGVVDPDLKLKGAEGIRIVDGSVLPLIPTAHTQVPIYILAERASDLIKSDWNL